MYYKLFNSYTNADSEVTPLPDSAPSTPATKKGKTKPTLSELQDNIVRLVAQQIKVNADCLAILIKNNTDTIEDLKKTTEFLFQEIRDTKEEITTVKQVSDDYQKRITVMEDKINDMDHYHRHHTAYQSKRRRM